MAGEKDVRKDPFDETMGELRTRSNKALLEEVWEKLQVTSHVTFRFRSHNNNGGEGTGEVIATYDGNARCIFQERGLWYNIEGQEFAFINAFQWTRNRLDGLLTLEHLRFGEHHPVFLLHLVPVGEKTLEPLHAHLCGEDTYFGQLVLNASTLELTWRILGPKKNDEVCHIYY